MDFHYKDIVPWGDRLTNTWVGTEVRIFPIVDVNSNLSPFLSPVVGALEKDGIACSVERVPYHFQKTGNEMLRLRVC